MFPMDGSDDPLTEAALEYLDLYSLYDILENSGVTDVETVVHLLRTSFIELPPFLGHHFADEEEDEQQ